MNVNIKKVKVATLVFDRLISGFHMNYTAAPFWKRHHLLVRSGDGAHTRVLGGVGGIANMRVPKHPSLPVPNVLVLAL